MGKKEQEIAEYLSCPSCKGIHFIDVFALKKESAILSESGQEKLIPMSAITCLKCGHNMSQELAKPNGERSTTSEASGQDKQEPNNSRK